MKKTICLILVVFALWSVKPALAAGPMLKFSPSSGTYTKGSTFTVMVGVDSGTEKSQNVDVFATFDASKLRVISIDPVASPAFPMALGKTISEGGFDLSCYSPDTSTFNTTVINGDLVAVTFEAKATGTVNVNFTCQQGSQTDSNIFNTAYTDVISCSLNQNAVYTIAEGGGAPDPTSVPDSNPTAQPTSQPTNTLPQTGSMATTMGLLVFGLVGILSSWALRFL